MPPRTLKPVDDVPVQGTNEAQEVTQTVPVARASSEKQQSVGTQSAKETLPKPTLIAEPKPANPGSTLLDVADQTQIVEPIKTDETRDEAKADKPLAPKITPSDVKKPRQAPTQQVRPDKKLLVDVKHIYKSFYAGTEETQVLKDISVQIYSADFLIIVGPSGSGKSTLLHILLGLEIPTAGELNFLGKDLYKDTTEDIRSEFRKQHIGMVYQQPNWIKSMSVLENIAFPLILRGYRKELAHEIAYGALQEVHMEMHANQPAMQLSGGQQQRVSLARCIVHNPEIIVADEPTGNLDYESGQEVMQLLQSLNVKDKKTVIMVTHDIEYIKFANCAVQIFDGKVAGYYGEGNLDELLEKLHTKHLDVDSFKESYENKTN